MVVFLYTHPGYRCCSYNISSFFSWNNSKPLHERQNADIKIIIIKTCFMKLNANKKAKTNTSFNDSFNYDKMKLLLNEVYKHSFSEKFKHWLQAYTKTTMEKVWIDIESYHAG
jgi:hypothetical protein